MRYKNQNDIFNFACKVEDLTDKGTAKIRVASFNTIDKEREIIAPEAFDKSIAKFNANKGANTVKHMVDHRVTIGLPLEMTKNADGFDIITKININKIAGQDVYSDYLFFAENGQTLTHSFFAPILNRNKNILTDLDLKEYSTMTTQSMNDNTPLLAIKGEMDNSDTEMAEVEMEDTATCDYCGRTIDFTDKNNVIKTISDLIDEFAFQELKWMSRREVEKEIEKLRPDVNSLARERIAEIAIKGANMPTLKFAVCKGCGNTVLQKKKKTAQKGILSLIDFYTTNKKELTFDDILLNLNLNQ